MKSCYAIKAKLREQLTTKITDQSKLLIDYSKWHSSFYFVVKFDKIHITVSFVNKQNTQTSSQVNYTLK